MIINRIIKKIKNFNYQTNRRNTWRSLNRHNFTTINTNADYELIKVGKGTYGHIELFANTSSEDNKLIVGNFCSIADEVQFMLANEHPLSQLSTYPFHAMIINDGPEAKSKGNIIIEDDVWIGQRVIILSNTRIGQGAVVAAGAVVTMDVPPYTIVGGVPARVIKKRFDDETIDFLLSLDFSKLNENLIRDHIDALYLELEQMSLESIREAFEWFPKKLIDE